MCITSDTSRSMGAQASCLPTPTVEWDQVPDFSQNAAFPRTSVSFKSQGQYIVLHHCTRPSVIGRSFLQVTGMSMRPVSSVDGNRLSLHHYLLHIVVAEPQVLTPEQLAQLAWMRSFITGIEKIAGAVLRFGGGMPNLVVTQACHFGFACENGWFCGRIQLMPRCVHHKYR